jgi:hypothetical protein
MEKSDKSACWPMSFSTEARFCCRRITRDGERFLKGPPGLIRPGVD